MAVKHVDNRDWQLYGGGIISHNSTGLAFRGDIKKIFLLVGCLEGLSPVSVWSTTAQFSGLSSSRQAPTLAGARGVLVFQQEVEPEAGPEVGRAANAEARISGALRCCTTTPSAKAR